MYIVTIIDTGSFLQFQVLTVSWYWQPYQTLNMAV